MKKPCFQKETIRCVFENKCEHQKDIRFYFKQGGNNSSALGVKTDVNRAFVPCKKLYLKFEGAWGLGLTNKYLMYACHVKDEGCKEA